jgi:hypothetical protein
MSLSTSIASRRRFFIQAAIVTVALWLSMEWFKAHYRIGIATQQSTCLPGWRVFLMDLDDRIPRRDAIYAFRTKGIAVTLPAASRAKGSSPFSPTRCSGRNSPRGLRRSAKRSVRQPERGRTIN